MQQIGLVDLFDGLGVLSGGGGHGVEADGATTKVFDHDRQQAAIGPVEAAGVNVEQFQRFRRQGDGNGPSGFDLDVVAHSPQEAVGNPGGAPGAPGNFFGPWGLNRGLQHVSRAQHNGGEFIDFVEPQPLNQAKAIAQR